MKKLFILYLLFIFPKGLCAQNVGIGTITPDASAQLEINSTTKGLLIPHMSMVQRNLIGSPAPGLLIFQTDNTPGFYYFTGLSWQTVSNSAGLSLPYVSSYGGASNAFEINTIGSTNNAGIKSASYNTNGKGFSGEARGTNSVAGYFTVIGAPAGASALQTDAGDVYLATTSGNVGIGLTGTSVTEKLHLDANMKLGNAVWSTAGNDRLIKFGDGNFVSIGEAGQDDRMTLTAKNFIFSAATSPGYIGINTTTPTSPLSFGNIIGDKINLWNTDATHNYGIGLQGGLLQIHSNDVASDIAFGFGSSSSLTERARIFGSGGIQSQGPNAAFWFKDRSINTYAGWSWYADNGKANLYRYGVGDVFTLDGSGNMGIGTTAPSAKLEVNGTFKLTDATQAAGRVLTSDVNGNAAWTDMPQPFINAERFKVSGFGVSTDGSGLYSADFTNVLYNYSANIVIDLTVNSITFNTAGLYRLEYDTKVTNTAQNLVDGFLQINGVNEYINSALEQRIGVSAFYTVSMHVITDMYLPAGTVVKIISSSSGVLDNYLAGYLIAQ